MGDLEPTIAALLSEDRAFAPPPESAARALVNDRSIYEHAEATTRGGRGRRGVPIRRAGEGGHRGVLRGHREDRQAPRAHLTDDLPKTRSGKIMRRLLRDVARGRPLGDVTTLANVEVVEQIRDMVEAGKGED